MSERFENLKKIPEGPAARFLADGNIKLDTKLDAPASASVSVVLAELEQKEAWVDMLKVMSAVLPARECVWWSCLAARDVSGETLSPVLKAAETWVFGPTGENREKLRVVLEMAGPDDDCTLCGTAAYYADGTLGVGELEDQPAPAGAVSACAFGQNLLSLDEREDAIERMQFLIDRALDIARGGNGRVPEPGADPNAEAEGGEDLDAVSKDSAEG